MRTLLAAAESESAILTVLGDLNAKHSSWQPDGPGNTAGTKFFELLLDFGLTQCVQSPTRFSRDGTSCSVIDLYSTNRADLLTNIDISDPVSDHCMVTVARLELNAQRALPSSGLGPMKVIYDFKNVDWHKINKDLMNAPLLQAIQGTQDVECALAVWESIVTETLLRHIPIRQAQEKPNKKPWMTSELYRLTKTKFRLFKKARSSRSPAAWSKYTRFRNHCTSQVRSAKALYMQRKHKEISSAADGSHHWWTLAKKLAKISTPRATMPELHANETVATNDADKANLLANFFAQQCTATTTNEDLPGAPLPLPQTKLCTTSRRSRNSPYSALCNICPATNPPHIPCSRTLSWKNAHHSSPHLCPTSSTSRSQQASSLLCGSRQLWSLSTRTEVRQKIHLTTDLYHYYPPLVKLSTKSRVSAN